MFLFLFLFFSGKPNYKNLSLQVTFEVKAIKKKKKISVEDFLKWACCPLSGWLEIDRFSLISNGVAFHF